VKAASNGELLIPDEVVSYYENLKSKPYEATSVRLLFLVRAVAQRINDISAIWLEPFGLTPLSYNVLARLLATPGNAMALTTLSRSLHTRAATITSLIHALEHDSLVRRVAHSTDGRATLAKLTATGRRVAERATDAQHRHILEALKATRLRDREFALEILLEIGEALGAEQKRLRGDQRPPSSRRPVSVPRKTKATPS
jgi:DNA-binding MarR family transcriptional regulator